MYTYLEYNKDALDQSEIEISTIFENWISQKFLYKFPTCYAEKSAEL